MKNKFLTLTWVVMVPFLSLSFASAAVALDESQDIKKVEKLIKKADRQIDKGAVAEAKGNEKKAGKHYGKADDTMDEAEEILENGESAGKVIDAGCGNVGQPPC